VFDYTKKTCSLDCSSLFPRGGLECLCSLDFLKEFPFLVKSFYLSTAGHAFGHIYLLFHYQLLRIVLPRALPPTNSSGVFCSTPSPWLCARAPGPSTSSGIPGGSLASRGQHWGFFSQTTRCHKCITVSNSDDEIPGEATKGTSTAPKPPSRLPKCCTCFVDKEQLLLLELSVKGGFLSAKVTINNRITLKNVSGKCSSIYNSRSVSSCELPAFLKSTNLCDS